MGEFQTITDDMIEPTRAIRVGLIGYGTFHAPLILATPGLPLSVVGSSDPAKVHADLPGVEVLGDPLALSASSDIDRHAFELELTRTARAAWT